MTRRKAVWVAWSVGALYWIGVAAGFAWRSAAACAPT
jgi:hypothetical protein